ncbi:hypothetical protein [Gordonia hankookensis]|uniref:Uncharacterized protein n=1 Tax=Gordonia hankookensis TaxID=589403 RepID=A0ABR7W5H9_9ACTN|nr:hypothetical protein [Gordonia hankookensis]MBD1318003.1 hypothetical protein [Gordonia hankookensis]
MSTAVGDNGPADQRAEFRMIRNVHVAVFPECYTCTDIKAKSHRGETIGLFKTEANREE